MRRTRCTGVINKLVRVAIHEQKITRARDIVANNSQDILTQAFKILICILYQAPRRPEDLVMDNVYERWRAKNT